MAKHKLNGNPATELDRINAHLVRLDWVLALEGCPALGVKRSTYRREMRRAWDATHESLAGSPRSVGELMGTLIRTVEELERRLDSARP